MADYTELLAHIAENGSLRRACRELGVNKSSFLDAVDKNKALSDLYVHARARGIDNVMEELLDSDINDASISRLEWDRKRWHASKLFPRKYGEKTLVGSDPENPLPAGVAVTFKGVKPE